MTVKGIADWLGVKWEMKASTGGAPVEHRPVQNEAGAILDMLLDPRDPALSTQVD